MKRRRIVERIEEISKRNEEHPSEKDFSLRKIIIKWSKLILVATVFSPIRWRKSWMWQVSLSKSSLCDVRIFQRDISPAFDEGIQWTSNPMKSTYRFPTICKITSLKLCSIRWRKSREEMYMYIVIMYNNSNVKFDKVLLSRFNTNRVCKD